VRGVDDLIPLRPLAGLLKPLHATGIYDVWRDIRFRDGRWRVARIVVIYMGEEDPRGRWMSVGPWGTVHHAPIDVVIC